MFVDDGFLALQLEARGDIAVDFRNPWLFSQPVVKEASVRRRPHVYQCPAIR